MGEASRDSLDQATPRVVRPKGALGEWAATRPHYHPQDSDVMQRVVVEDAEPHLEDLEDVRRALIASRHEECPEQRIREILSLRDTAGEWGYGVSG